MKAFNSLVHALIARLYSQVPTARFKQRGASALEYLVLAAVVVIVIGAAAFLVLGDDSGGVINEAFNNIADCIKDGEKC